MFQFTFTRNCKDRYYNTINKKYSWKKPKKYNNIIPWINQLVYPCSPSQLGSPDCKRSQIHFRKKAIELIKT